MLNILSQFVTKDNIFTDEPMKNHTSFKIGGPADFLVIPTDKEQLVNLIRVLKDLEAPIFIMGNGSNLLVSDNGIRGVVIKTTGIKNLSVNEDVITAGCGLLMSRIASQALNNSLGGMEFAHGIPGTLGGGVVMNAGAYGGELKDIIISSEYADKSGNVFSLADHDFGYRHSFFTDNRDCIVLESKIKLREDSPSKIRSLMTDLAHQRSSKQPLDLPSAGSFFKRPEGHFAGKLISDSGLRGYRIGDAQVSKKHAGFIVNRGNATADDVFRLFEYVQKKIYTDFNVTLECEVRIVK